MANVFLSSLDQTHAAHGGPIGRVTELKNGVSTHYTPASSSSSGAVAARFSIETRDGLQSLPATLRSVATGGVVSGSWSGPEHLVALADKVLSVCSSVPRAYNGVDWTLYPDARVVSNKLTQSVFHTSSRVIQASSSAKVGNVMATVWTEVGYTPVGNPFGTTYISIKSGNVWLLSPTVLHGPGVANQPVLAKVVTDEQLFWSFTNEDTTGHILIKVWDTHGAVLASKAVGKNSTTSPGDWDVTYQTSGHVVLVQPTDGTGASDGVDLSSLGYSSGTITEVRTTDSTVHCRGALSWLTNDLDGLGYLATLGSGGRVWGYQVNTAAKLHEFNVNRTVTNPAYLDSFIGWSLTNGTIGQATLYVGVAYLADGTTASAGPKFDPAFRETTVYSCTWADVVTQVRKNMSTVPVSRAFLHNGEYSYFSYYQSGSGAVSNVKPITVSHTLGDFMTGPVSQPIKVAAGDSVTGAPFDTVGVTSPGDSGRTVNDTMAFALTGTSGDTVALVSASGFANSYGVPDGTPLLKWHIAGLSVNDTLWGSRISVTGATGIAGINDSYIVAAYNGVPTEFYTYAAISNGSFPSGTFTNSNFVRAMAMVRYNVAPNPAFTDAFTLGAYTGGTITVAGSGVADGVKSIYAIIPATIQPAGWPDRYLVIRGSEGFTTALFTATVAAPFPYRWTFAAGNPFDASFVGAFLDVNEANPPSDTPALDTGEFGITAGGPSGELFTTGADAVGTIPHQWTRQPYPIVAVSQDLDKAYRFFLQTVTFDYSLIGALISVQGDSTVPTNNGVYSVLSIDQSDTGFHTVFVKPMNSKSDQRNQLFGAETITIFPKSAVAPEFQPMWFITPATGTQPQVGAFERGIADADWRQEGQVVGGQPFPNLYPRALSDVSSDLQVVLPYRARSFVAGQLLTAPTGQVVNAASTLLQSTIGLKEFQLSPDTGDALQSFDEILFPGPMAASFTSSGFHEHGINVGVEQPFVVSEEHDTSTGVVGMVPLQKYTYQVVANVMDENGDNVVSIPSPALQVTLTGTNNTATIGFRTINPLDTAGLAIAGAFGLSNRLSVAYSINRTAFINGTPTTNLYEITNPLNPNGPLYPGAGAGSGFTFLNDGHTVYFRDQTADAVIVDNEVIYTGQGFLPAFPAPPFNQGCVWQNRTWLCGYDGALWMSNEKQEGSGLSFFPAFRYIFPANAVACAYLDSFLYVFCDDDSIWYVPATTYPDATGNPQSGTMPKPRRLPFRNGCTGHATTIREGVVYSSTAGGGEQLWLIDRSQQNHWLSQSVQDDFTAPITGLTVDSKQRLYVANGQLWCYDGIPGLWSQVVTQSVPVKVATLNGNLTYQDSGFVSAQTPGTHADVLNGTTYPIPLDITLAGINFADVRSFTRLWAMQIVGEYRGPHKLNAVISYPDDMPDFPTQFLQMVPDPSKPYLIEVNPINELCSTYGLRVYSSFEGISVPGDSFTIELVSCKVGLTQGQRDVPSGQRYKGG